MIFSFNGLKVTRGFVLLAFTFFFARDGWEPAAWGQGQAPPAQWIRQFGTGAPLSDTAFALDSDGNTYVAGNVGAALPGQTGFGSGDAFIRKYDGNGNEVWTRQFGTGSYDEIRGISTDSSAIYVAGYTQGALPGQSSLGGGDAFVRKYDGVGNEVWTRQFGSSLLDQAIGISADASGIYVAGVTNGTLPGQSSAGGSDAFVRKYDASGNAVWTRQFGSSVSDAAGAISVDSSGIYVGGNVALSLPGQPSFGNGDAFVRKYDANGIEQWTRQFGTSAFDQTLAVSSDGVAIYVGGRTDGTLPAQSGAGGTDAFVRKYDVSGAEIWTRQFGTAAFDSIAALSSDDSAVYVTGRTDGTLEGQSSAGGTDAFVRKYDGSGAEMWTRQFGTPSFDQAFGVSAGLSSVYVVGQTNGVLPGQISAGSADAFVRKYDTGGSEQWTRQFGTSRTVDDFAFAVDSDGNAYIAGRVDGVFPGQLSAGGTDAFLRKYDSDGNELWTRQFGSSGLDEARGIAVDSSGVYVAGSILSGAFPGQVNAGSYDAFVRKYDANGNEQWTRQFGTSAMDIAQGVSADFSSVYVAGYTGGALPGQGTNAGCNDVFVRAYDANGNPQWTRQFGTSSCDQAYGVNVDASGVYVAGRTEGGTLPGQSGAGGHDAFVRKYDLAGTVQWTRQFGSPSQDSALGVSADVSGVYVAGYTWGDLPGQASAGGTDAFLRKYDTGGNLVWTRQFGSSATDIAYSVSVDSSGIFVGGYTFGTLPGQTTAGGSSDAFVRKYDTNANEQWTRQFGSSGDDFVNGISGDISGVYLVGYTDGILPGQTSSGNFDAFVAKFGDGLPNSAPAIGADFSLRTVNEGQTATNTGTYVDQNAGDDVTITASVGSLTKTGTNSGTWSWSFATTDGPAQSQTVTISANDGKSGTSLTTFDLVVNNVPATALNDSYSTNEDTPLNAAAPGVLGNDTGAGIGETLTAVLVAPPAHATSFALNSNGSFSYTAASNYSGADSFTYKVNDGDGDSGAATVLLTVHPVNDPPVANNDSYSTNEDTTLNLVAPGVVSNDTDVDGDTLTAVLVNGPSHGTLTLNGNGSLTYNPSGNYSGVDTFNYKTKDPSNAESNVATVTVVVNPVNDPPVAFSQLVTTNQNTAIFVSLAGADVEGAPLTFVIVSGPSKGTLTGTPSTLIYMPNPNASGTDSFTFMTSDGQLFSNVGTVSITILDVTGPVTSSVTYKPDPLPVNTPLTLTAIVSDAITGGSNVASAEYQIEQGVFVPMNASDNNFNQVAESVTANVPAVTSPGVNSICVRGQDAAGNAGAPACILLAVYDPNGGFVTGGGWINSPEGAYRPDGVTSSNLKGRVNFSFLSKYKKGTSTLTGETELQFQLGNFNFHGGLHDWLVVSGFKAQYEGSGTANGSGGYGFLLTVTDGDLNDLNKGSDKADKFRIKIWNKVTGLTIYDNVRGISDDMDDANPQAIDGGSIIIHQK